MLAAILLNLDDYQVKRGGGGRVLAVPSAPKKHANQTVREAAEVFKSLLNGTPKAVKAADIAQKVADVMAAAEFDFKQFTEAQRQLQMLRFEIRTSVLTLSTILDDQLIERQREAEQLLNFIARRMDDDEAVLAILLT
jgi:hypothetical protein